MDYRRESIRSIKKQFKKDFNSSMKIVFKIIGLLFVVGIVLFMLISI